MIHESASNQILLISQPTEQNTVLMKRKICKAQQILKKSVEELALKFKKLYGFSVQPIIKIFLLLKSGLTTVHFFFKGKCL